MSRNRPALFACLIVLALAACQGQSNGLVRRVRFQGHDTVTAWHASGASLMTGTSGGAAGGMAERASAGWAPAVFLLGYDPSTKAEVASALTSSGGSILQNIPASDHWLVRSTPADIQSLQERLPSVTAAVLPKQAKISGEIERTVREVVQGTQQRNGRANWLDDLVHYETEDGRTQIMLSIDRPAFATVKNAYCSDCPEKEEALNAAGSWAHDMRDGLAAQLSLAPGDACQPLVKHYATVGTLGLVVCAEHATRAATWLAEQGEVVSVSLVYAAKIQNLHASHAVQTGAAQSPLPDNFGRDGTRQQLFPLWEAGITGKGQNVGISDTGIDLNNCYFYDPDFMDYRNNTDNIQNTTDHHGNKFEHFSNSNHRKVTSYFHFLDYYKTDLGGHGTHVAGTVAGAAFGFDPVQDPDLATGVAPEAKISFFDLSAGGWGLQLPGSSGNGTSSIFDVQHKEGARIATNSWGASQSYYTSDCRGIDAWTHANDMLVLFAAGNDGYGWWPGTLGTIGSPATCKNVLSIGATDNYNFQAQPDRLINDEGEQIHQDGFQGNLTTVDDELLFNIQEPFGGYQTERYIKGSDYKVLNTGFVQGLGPGSTHKLAHADPPDACSNLIGDYNEKVTFFESSIDCSLSEQVSNIKAAGAAAGIVGVNHTAFEEIGNFTLDDEDFPVVAIAYSLFVSNYSNGYMVVMGGSPQDYLLGSSSYGPSDKDYILPTLTAPGIVLSAEASGGFDPGQSSCSAGVQTLKGTSMASPTAAGAAALVRQYFTDGFYPTGSRSAEDAFEPAASLLAAVLVAGASAMDGVALRNEEKLTMFDRNQGFGRVDLSSLPLAGITGENWRLQVSRDQAMAADREKHAYTVPANGEAPLILTLAWMDLPAQATGYDAEPLLQNDLDLKVTAPNGSVLWGNDKEGGDRANTVEKIIIERPQAGEYSVEVSTIFLQEAEGAQNYSFVALGGITGDMVMSTMPPGPSFPPPPPSPPENPPISYPPPAAPWWPFYPDGPVEPPSMPYYPNWPSWPPYSPDTPPRPPYSPDTPPWPPYTPEWPGYPAWPPPSPEGTPPHPAPPPSLAIPEGNQRALEVTYELDIDNDKADALEDENSSLYKKFKAETEKYMEAQLPYDYKVIMDGLIVSSIRRRALLQAATTVSCQYVIQAPEDASSDVISSITDALTSRLNNDRASTEMMRLADLGEFNIESTSAETMDGGGDDSAQRVGPVNLFTWVLGAALLLAL